MPSSQRLNRLEALTFALFAENGAHTCEMVAEALDVPESVAQDAIDTLVEFGLLIEARSGPKVSVWKLYGGPG